MRNLCRFPSSYLAVAASLMIALGQSPGRALTVTSGITADNGYPAHKVQWTDSAGKQRTAIMIDQVQTQTSNSLPNLTGYLRQYSYFVGSTLRTCTGRANDGGLETSGDGFVQNHAPSGDFSDGDGNGTPGTTTITLAGASHAMITYDMPGYQINGQTVPTTVQWFFADGRNDPIFTVTQDARQTGGNVGSDSRSPYGDMAYDGDATGDATVGGFSWGDTYRFVTFDQAMPTYANQVTPESAWDDTAANTIPYAMSWAEPDTVDAEMGHVATVPISTQDEGQDNEDAALTDDPRGKSSASGLPPATAQAFQINGYSFGGYIYPLLLSNDPNVNNTNAQNPPYPYPTDDKHITWGANFGKLGGYSDNTANNANDYPQHRDNPINQYHKGTPTNGLLMAYSVFVVLGPHGSASNVYNTSGAVGTMVTQMQNVTAATLTAMTGSVATTGPQGVGSANNATITYSPAGYNPIYSAWEVTAAGNAVNATLTPATGKALINPVFFVDGYTSAQLPASISVGSGLTTAGTDYFVSLDTTRQRLAITVNRTISAAMNLQVTVAAAASPTNTFLGANSGNTTLSGLNDTGVGDMALNAETTGGQNTGLGYYALSSVTGGSFNTATGCAALQVDTTGSGNTGNGYGALFSNSDGYSNVATGYYAMAYSSEGVFNTADGCAVMQNNSTGSRNTGSGYAAFFSTSTGSNNAANGYQAMVSDSTGGNNTAQGDYALGSTTTGTGNIALGFNAGQNLAGSGSNNIDIGGGVFGQSGDGTAADAGVIRIGTPSGTGAETSTFIAGIAGTTMTGAGVSVNSSGQVGVLTSSRRFKDHIQGMKATSDPLLSLQPVSYEYKPALDPAGTVQFGLVAEQVAQVDQDLIVRDKGGAPFTVRYQAVDAMLLNEFLKEHQQVQDQQALLDQDRQKLDSLKTMIRQVESLKKRPTAD